MGASRSRTPNERGARDIAGALYPDLDGVDWIPSDDADVFRLSFASGREPRILKPHRRLRSRPALPGQQRSGELAVKGRRSGGSLADPPPHTTIQTRRTDQTDRPRHSIPRAARAALTVRGAGGG